MMDTPTTKTLANNLKFISYNFRGYNDSKKDYICSLLKRCDILFLQEHWLPDSQLQVLDNISSCFLITGVSGFSSDEVLSGRPFGGCTIFGDRLRFYVLIKYCVIAGVSVLLEPILLILLCFLLIFTCHM